jgi:hypothetical protein
VSGGALSFSVLFGGRYRHPISATANLSHPNDVEQPDRVARRSRRVPFGPRR